VDTLLLFSSGSRLSFDPHVDDSYSSSSGSTGARHNRNRLRSRTSNRLCTCTPDCDSKGQGPRYLLEHNHLLEQDHVLEQNHLLEHNYDRIIHHNRPDGQQMDNGDRECDGSNPDRPLIAGFIGCVRVKVSSIFRRGRPSRLHWRNIGLTVGLSSSEVSFRVSCGVCAPLDPHTQNQGLNGVRIFTICISFDSRELSNVQVSGLTVLNC